VPVTRRIGPLTLDTLDGLPTDCRSCVAWELDPVRAARAAAAGEAAAEKEAWVSAVLLEWGSCGRIAYVDDQPVGHALYAPPALLPRSAAFPTGPPAADAALLASVEVRPGHGGLGLGRMLVQAVVKDLATRGIRGLEAFGRVGSDGDGGGVGALSCLVPAGFLLAVGFKTVRPHPRTPRLRLDLRSTVSWRADVEGAIEKLLGSIQPAPVGVRRIGPEPGA